MTYSYTTLRDVTDSERQYNQKQAGRSDLALRTVRSLFASCGCSGRLQPTYSRPNQHPRSNIRSNLNSYAHAGAYSHPETRTNLNSYAHGDAYSHPETRTNLNSYAHAGAYSHPETRTNLNSYAHGDAGTR